MDNHNCGLAPGSTWQQFLILEIGLFMVSANHIFGVSVYLKDFGFY